MIHVSKHNCHLQSVTEHLHIDVANRNWIYDGFMLCNAKIYCTVAKLMTLQIVRCYLFCYVVIILKSVSNKIFR